MEFINKLEQGSLITNTKGGSYYASSFNDNLDVFCSLGRGNREDEILTIFHNALQEDKALALANLLYLLDIRSGKGERRIFKIIFKDLCSYDTKSAEIILPYISQMGRFDYVLEALDTPLEQATINLIKEQLQQDINSNNPSLLGKWLPSLRTHKKNNYTAKMLAKKLNMDERTYRKTLSLLRSKINIVEKNLTNKAESIDFEKVPSKAMLKYTSAFERNYAESYSEYLSSVKNGEKKMNAKVLTCTDIVKKFYLGGKRTEGGEKTLNLLWENQEQIDLGDSNILVMADTSGSMILPNLIPLSTSVGLALYISQHNHGYFKDYYMTFSSKPLFQKVKGDSFCHKMDNIKCIVENTNIDEAFELLLETASDNNIPQEEMPSSIIIVSDMEFDAGVYSKKGTNFSGWKKAFQEKGYTLPKIVFWNVAMSIRGIPVCKHDNDVVMVNGYSLQILKSIGNLEEYNPIQIMLDTLKPYLDIINSKIN